MSRKKKRRNPEISTDEVKHGIGSGASALGRKILSVVATEFGGGHGFTPHELAQEASMSETSVRRALVELKRLGYVHGIGRELNRQGKKGPERFVGTLIGEERSQSDRDLLAIEDGEAIAERQIAQEEALADFLSAPRAKPGKGKVYRPSIRRQRSRGHKLPWRTAERIRAAGYRVCNPTEAQALAHAIRIGGGDLKQALRFLEGATDPASRAALNKLIRLRLPNPKGSTMKKKHKKKPAKKVRHKKTPKKAQSKKARPKTPKRCTNAKKPSPKRARRAAQRRLPAGYKILPARHGLHGYLLVLPGRSDLDGILVTSKGEALRRAREHAGWVAKHPAKKSNPQTPQESALELVAKRGKRGAARFAKQQEKHARSHGYKAETKRWRAIRVGVARIRLGAAPKSARTKNPLSGVVAAAAASNPIVSRMPVGKMMKWKDAPASVRRDPLAQKAVRLASRRLGIPMDEVPGEVCEGPQGTPAHTNSSGEVVSFSYKTPAGSKDSHTRSGRRIVYDHKAGDQGRGKKPTRPMLLVNDPRTGLPILVSRRGSRPGFSSRRGQTG